MKHLPLNSNTGFTLVEMLVAVGIFSVVVGITIGAIITSNSSFQKTRLNRTATENVNVALESMARSIREGSNYAVLPSGNQGSEFSFLSSTGDTTTYRLSSAGTEPNHAIEVQNGSGNAFRPLTSAEGLDVKNLTFFVTPGSAEVQPRVTIVVSGRAQLPGKSELDTIFSIETTVSQQKLVIASLTGGGGGGGGGPSPSPSGASVCNSGSTAYIHTYTDDFNQENSICTIDIDSGAVSGCKTTFPGPASEIFRAAGSLYAVKFNITLPLSSSLYGINEGTGESTYIANVEPYSGCYYSYTVAANPALDADPFSNDGANGAIRCVRSSNFYINSFRIDTGVLGIGAAMELNPLSSALQPILASAFDASGNLYLLGKKIDDGTLALKIIDEVSGDWVSGPSGPTVPVPFDDMFEAAGYTGFPSPQFSWPSGSVGMFFGQNGFLYIVDSDHIFKIHVGPPGVDGDVFGGVTIDEDTDVDGDGYLDPTFIAHDLNSVLLPPPPLPPIDFGVSGVSC